MEFGTMRGMLVLWCAILALGIAAPFPAAAEQTDAEKAELANARAVPLIGDILADLAQDRQMGLCSWRESAIARAEEQLDFFGRYHKQRPADTKVTDKMLDDARKAFDAEKGKQCSQSSNNLAVDVAASKLPKLIGTVTPMPSKLEPDASVQARSRETFDALEKIFDDETRCDVHTARRWLENLRELVREAREAREAALAAGEYSKIDPIVANERATALHGLLDLQEIGFTEYRVKCAEREAKQAEKEKSDKAQTDKSKPAPADGSQKIPECPPGAKGCPLPGQNCPEGSGGGDGGCRRYPPLPLCDEGNEQFCAAEQACDEYGDCDQPYQEDPGCIDCFTDPEIPYPTWGVPQIPQF